MLEAALLPPHRTEIEDAMALNKKDFDSEAKSWIESNGKKQTETGLISGYAKTELEKSYPTISIMERLD